MSKNGKIIATIAVVAILAIVAAFLKPNAPAKVSPQVDFQAGAAGNMKAEEYIPYVLYNDGYNSAKDIKTSGTLSTSGSLSVTGTAAIGSTGTSLNSIIASTCTLIGTDVSHAASTTKPYDCAVTNMTSSFNVIAQISTSTPRLAQSGPYWDIVGSKASSTAGYITVLLYNNGPAAVPSVTSVGSSTPYWAWR